MSFWRSSGDKAPAQPETPGGSTDDKGMTRAFRAIEQKMRLDWSNKGVCRMRSLHAVDLRPSNAELAIPSFGVFAEMDTGAAIAGRA